MHIRNRTMFGFAFGVALLLAFAVAGSGPSVAEELGLAVKKPVVAAACKLCPWGAIADVLKEALKPQGYDLQICYTCSARQQSALCRRHYDAAADRSGRLAAASEPSH